MDTLYLRLSDRSFYLEGIVERVSYGIRQFIEFLKNLGFQEPYAWRPGIVGAQGFGVFKPKPPNSLSDPGRPMHRCNSDNIEEEGTLYSGQTIREAIRPFIDLACRRCGFTRP